MEKKKAPLSIRIIYWITQVAFVLFIITCAAVLVANILLYTGFFGNDMQLITKLPVKVDFLEVGNLHLDKADVSVKLVEAETRIQFCNTPKFLARWFGGVLIIVVALMFYIIWVFRKFIINVKKGLIFELKNIAFLKRFAYGLLAMWIVVVVYNKILYYSIVKYLEFDNVLITCDENSYNGILFFALFIWMLSHIFTVGVKLQNDQNLTI